MNAYRRVRSGRTGRCPRCKHEQFCAGCKQAIKFGDPKSLDLWAGRLSLTEDQINLLLVAAAEFEDLHRHYVARARRYDLPIPPAPTAWDFVDWVDHSIRPPEGGDYDGIRVHNSTERAPDPLPYVERTWRR